MPVDCRPVTRPVLVVDDDPIVRDLIRRALEDEGILGVTAADGAEALEHATRLRPDLVILDVSLPVLGGEAVAHQLRQITSDEELPIMAITADGRPAEKARRLGAFAYLAKPFDVDALVEVVQRALRDEG